MCSLGYIKERELWRYEPLDNYYYKRLDIWWFIRNIFILPVEQTGSDVYNGHNKKKMRFDNITISKGFAIVLMVVVHARFSEYGSAFVNMFHMPLFFFFSGYCFKEQYINNFGSYAQKRIKGIYFPYVKWGLFFLMLHNVFFHLNIYNDVF